MIGNKDKQTRIFFCQLNELDALKEYLERKAEQGWMLIKRKGSGCYFKRSTPKKVKYSVEVFEQAWSMDSGETESNKEYISYCQAAGWNFVSEDGNVHIFYSEDRDAVPIETDSAMKFKTIHKSIIKQYRFIWIFFPLLTVVNLWTWSLGGWIEVLTSYMIVSSRIVWLLAFFIHLSHMLTYLHWFYKTKQALENGEPLQYKKRTESTIRIVLAIMILSIWGLTFLSIGMGENIAIKALIIIGCSVAAITESIKILVHCLRKSKQGTTFKERVMRFGMIAIGIIGVYFVLGVVILGYILGIWDQNTKWVTYKDAEGNPVTASYDNDEIPFTLEDLGISLDKLYDTSIEYEEKFIISEKSYYQYPIDEVGKELEYTIYGTYSQWAYNIVSKELLTKKGYLDFGYKEMELDTSGEMELYYSENEYYFYYLFFNHGVCIELKTNFKLQEEQVSMVIKKLFE